MKCWRICNLISNEDIFVGYFGGSVLSTKDVGIGLQNLDLGYLES